MIVTQQLLCLEQALLSNYHIYLCLEQALLSNYHIYLCLEQALDYLRLMKLSKTQNATARMALGYKMTRAAGANDPGSARF